MIVRTVSVVIVGACLWALPGAVDQEFAVAGGLSRGEARSGGPANTGVASPTESPSAGIGTSLIVTEATYQGRNIHWWARRAVQARKDANARGRTIRRLQATVRSKLAYPTGHWLDGAFLCIHRHERGAAGWQTATGNGYTGGLQFDRSFASTYGPSWAFQTFGGVERWPASVQITAAIHAWTTRGFGPWPTTRRMCGL